MNMLEDLLTDSELEIYKVTEYPFSLSIVYNALKQKQKVDPGYEVWVPLIYYKYAPYKRSRKTPDLIKPYATFISNKGAVCRVQNDKRTVFADQGKEGDYRTFAIRTAGVLATFTTHRALACSFLSIDRLLLGNERVVVAHPKDLQVNHIDGIKSNCDLDNLEWSTGSGNQQHAVSTGLIKSGKLSVHTRPVKGKVEFGEFTGHEFILHGLLDYKTYGFTQPNVVACCKGRLNSHKNCSWTYATEEDLLKLPHGLSDEIKSSLSGISKRIKI